MKKGNTKTSNIKDRAFWKNKFISQEAVVQRCSVKKVFLEISQNSQENTCARVSFLIKLQAQEHIFLQNTSGGCF